MECWPRNVDIAAPGAKQYPGWPMTIDQTDNYGRKAVAYLPTLKVNGATEPRRQGHRRSDRRVVYALRINGDTFQPKVFKKGTYTVEVDGKLLEGTQGRNAERPEGVEVDWGELPPRFKETENFRQPVSPDLSWRRRVFSYDATTRAHIRRAGPAAAG